MSSNNQEKIQSAMTREKQRLYTILDRNPAEAIKEARYLKSSSEINQLNLELIRAAIFVDGGGELKDWEVIQEGVSIYRRVYSKKPERSDLAYNLANGLTALAQATDTESQPWYLATSEMRWEARMLFESASVPNNKYCLKSQAYTNQGNLLSQAFRWVEAYDAYSTALRSDPENGVASSGLAKLLMGCIDRGIGDPNRLKSLAAKYIRLSKNSVRRTQEYGGERALRAIQALDPEECCDLKMPDFSDASEYAQFIAHNGLALSLTIEDLDSDVNSWDTLEIEAIREVIDADSGVPPIFAMWNVLKADFLAARWVAFAAATNNVPETGSYSDTLDYANYGVTQSFWMLAQRAAIDVLDRIAVAASEYLQLSGSPSSIYFWKRWHKTDDGGLQSPRQWHPEIQTEIEKGNTALIAIAELAEDISKGGFLYPKKRLRNSSTHRFVVLHDMGNESARSSRHVEHHNQAEFELQTIASLKLVRSALLYFIEMISIREARQNVDEGPTVSLFVPPYQLNPEGK